MEWSRVNSVFDEAFCRSASMLGGTSSDGCCAQVRVAVKAAATRTRNNTRGCFIRSSAGASPINDFKQTARPKGLMPSPTHGTTEAVPFPKKYFQQTFETGSSLDAVRFLYRGRGIGNTWRINRISIAKSMN